MTLPRHRCGQSPAPAPNHWLKLSAHTLSPQDTARICQVTFSLEFSPSVRFFFSSRSMTIESRRLAARTRRHEVDLSACLPRCVRPVAFASGVVAQPLSNSRVLVPPRRSLLTPLQFLSPNRLSYLLTWVLRRIPPCRVALLGQSHPELAVCGGLDWYPGSPSRAGQGVKKRPMSLS